MGAGVPRAGHNMLPEVREFRPFLLLQGQQPSVSVRLYRTLSTNQPANGAKPPSFFPRHAVKETSIEAASPLLRALPSESHLFLLDSRYGMSSVPCYQQNVSLSRVSNHNSCHNYGFFTIINLVLTRLLPVSWEGINYT